MIGAKFSTGEESLDRLIWTVSTVFPGSAYLLNALCMLVALLLSRPNWGKKIGMTDEFMAKLDEIRARRKESGNIRGIDTSLILAFINDVMDCYKRNVRSITCRNDLDNTSWMKGVVAIRGLRKDASILNFHSMICTLMYNLVPEDWKMNCRIALPRDQIMNERMSSTAYCYLSLIKPAFACLTASLLGPRPTVGALLSFLTPKIMVEKSSLDMLKVFSRPQDGMLHVTMDSNAYDTYSLPAATLVNYRDNLENRLRDIFDIFDRVGAREEKIDTDNLFQSAAEVLSGMIGENASENKLDDAGLYYKTAALDFDAPYVTKHFPRGHESLRHYFDRNLLRSFICTWDDATREQAMVLALRSYNDRVVSLHIICDGLKELKSLNKLDRCDIPWRMSVEEVVSVSKVDADYWSEVLGILAQDFRSVINCSLPEWLRDHYENKQAEFIDSLVREEIESVPIVNSRETARVFEAVPTAEIKSAPKSKVGFVESTNSARTDSEMTFAKFRKSKQGKEIYERWKKRPVFSIPGYSNMPTLFKIFGDAKYRSTFMHNCIIKVMEKEWRGGYSSV